MYEKCSLNQHTIITSQEDKEKYKVIEEILKASGSFTMFVKEHEINNILEIIKNYDREKEVLYIKETNKLISTLGISNNKIVLINERMNLKKFLSALRKYYIANLGCVVEGDIKAIMKERERVNKRELHCLIFDVQVDKLSKKEKNTLEITIAQSRSLNIGLVMKKLDKNWLENTCDTEEEDIFRQRLVANACTILK